MSEPLRLDRFELAVLLAIREALRLERERRARLAAVKRDAA